MARRFAAAVAAAFLLIPGVALGDETPVEIRMPPRVELNADIAPRSLAKSKPTPIFLRASTSVRSGDGSHPPALGEFELEIDRHARLGLGGIPACHPPLEEATVQEGCRKALVGKGSIDIGIQFPESFIPEQHNEVFIYYGGSKKGARTLFLWTEISVPTPAPIVIPIAIKADHGRFGLKAVGSVPKIAGGAGWIDRLELRFHRGIFSATHPSDGTFDLRELTDFVDGTRLVSGVALSVTSRLLA